MFKKKFLFVFLLLALLTQSCLQSAESNAEVKPQATATQKAEEKPASPTPTKPKPTSTPAEILPTATELALPSATPAPKVTITAVGGNLFIRRGPDMAYNPVSTLYKGTSAKALMRDVLSNWVQIQIPDSKDTGWVSIMTEYSKVEGDIGALPEFKIVDWPLPSYVRNCTHHQLILYPGAIYLESEVFEPQNEAWVYPGYYQVFDLDMPDPVELESIFTSEGTTIDIRTDGAGERRKCE